MAMVKQACEQDIPAIEKILADAVRWMTASGLQNRWNESNIRWPSLSKSFSINDFYIKFKGEVNCNQRRLKLRGLYEQAGFRCVGDTEQNHMALYVCQI